ncbi:DUF4422 domain-containing protein [Acinetobacter ursingii]|uniref:DUF4422 domain-containing protein n=2 Tax=Acinetobacter ursingii TaxID=108980 RepID=UPI00124FAB3B|nr:DUF4422 domain-containing protein [Acinetobacter ursingii]
MKTEIYIATHKAYDFPKIDGYIPIHVGKALTDLDLGIIGDNTGDHISELNPNFCELTALYWMWKNSDADILGLVHYRRYFESKNNVGKILTFDEFNIKNIGNKIFLIKQEKLYVEKFNIKIPVNTAIQYKFNHISGDWKVLESVISDLYPNYIESFIKISRDFKISFYNMFLGNRVFLVEYAEWLFSILFELSKRINISKYNSYQSRIYGFISERLLNVFVYHHRSKYSIEYFYKLDI